MNKNEFKQLLDNKLIGIDKIKVREILEYYDEIINDRVENGESEESVIMSFGDIDELVAKIIEEVGKINSRMDETLKEIKFAEIPKSITIKSYDKKVYVSVSDDEEVHIMYNENKNRKYEHSFIDGALIFGYKKRKFIEWVSAFVTLEDLLHREPIHLKIPKSFCGLLNVEALNGGINVSGIKGINKLNIITCNGRLIISDAQCDNAEFETSNGKIIVNNVEFISEANGETGNGKIECVNVKAAKLALRTSNGKIEASKIECSNVDLKTTNGRIELDIKGVREDFNIDTKSTTGYNLIDNIKYYSQRFSGACEDKQLKTKTVNGSIIINFYE